MFDCSELDIVYKKLHSDLVIMSPFEWALLLELQTKYHKY